MQDAIEHIASLRAFFRGHHDIVDSVGDDRPTPRPNWAMQCTNLLDEIEALLLSKAGGE